MQNNSFNSNDPYNASYDSGYESGYRAAMAEQARMSVSKKQPNMVAVVIKGVIAGIVGLCLLLYGIVMVGVTVETFSDDTVENLEWCDVNYNEKDYQGLMQSLELYGTMDEDFDKYWEFTEGYELYIECQQWLECEKIGLDGAEAKLQEKLSNLENMSRETKFNTNRNLFDGYIEEIKSLK